MPCSWARRLLSCATSIETGRDEDQGKVGITMLHRAKLAVGVVAISGVMALAPLATASASVDKSKGSNPNSPLCKLNSSEQKASSKSTNALEKAFASPNWSTAKNAMLSAFNSETKAANSLIGLLGGAPSNVKSAIGVLLKFDGTYKTLIQKSTSATQFESSIESAVKNPKLVSAETTLTNYFNGQCGTTTPTT
jgi:hypothetical protein